MFKEPTLIIADKENNQLYKAMSSKNTNVYVSSSKDALDVLKKYSAEVVIIDCGFNINQGLKLLSEIKSYAPSTPIIFLSDISSEDLIIKIFRAGARNYFKKPINIFDLIFSVDKLMQYKKASEEKRIPYYSDEKHRDTGKLHSNANNIPKNMQQIIPYIEMNYSDNISISSLANEAHLSKFHFCRLFKKCFGISPKHFLTTVRLEKAKELLIKADYNVSIAAFESGFNDLSSFIKHFKKYTGFTPSEYKKSLYK